MPNIQNNIIWTLRDEVSATARKLNHQLDGLGVKSKGATGMLAKLGPATGGLITPFSLGAAGALALGAGLVAATRAAIEEEKNVAKLGAALKANVAGWDGNTAAIEANIAKSERLAFTDDDLRGSLALLVAATKDVGKAQTLQATAMDLARLKGISLEEASTALIRVEGGQYRMLKSLGIVLEEGATQTDALAAVTKLATGQAAAFANTTEGKLLTAQLKFDNAMEELGAVTLPMVAEAADTVVDALDRTGMSLEDVAEAARRGSQGAQAHLNAMGRTADEVFRDVGESARAGAYTVTGGLGDVAEAADDVGDASSGMSDDFGVSVDKMVADSRELRNKFVSDARDIIGDYYDPIIARAELVATRKELSDLRQTTSGRKATNAQKKQMAELEKKQAELLVELGTTGALTQKELGAAISFYQQKWKKASKAQRDEIDRIIRKLWLLQSAYRSVYTSGLVAPGDDNRALGGPVSAGRVYTVGERGPETLVMGATGGYVIPHAPVSGGGGGGGGIVITYAPQFSSASAAEAQRFMRAIVPELTRELRRQSVL